MAVNAPLGCRAFAVIWCAPFATAKVACHRFVQLVLPVPITATGIGLRSTRMVIVAVPLILPLALLSVRLFVEEEGTAKRRGASGRNRCARLLRAVNTRTTKQHATRRIIGAMLETERLLKQFFRRMAVFSDSSVRDDKRKLIAFVPGVQKTWSLLWVSFASFWEVFATEKVFQRPKSLAIHLLWVPG